MARRDSRMVKALREAVDDTIVVLAAEVAARLEGKLAEGVDAREAAEDALSGPLVDGVVREAIEGAANAGAAEKLVEALTHTTELEAAVDATRKMLARQARGLEAERQTRIDASEPAAQLDAIAGMLYARVPHVMHGREHLPLGTIILEVLDKRLPSRDPRGLMADNGWPGRRKPPKRG